MPRPKLLRRLSCTPPAYSFHPAEEDKCLIKKRTVVLTLDEFESLRLADLECHLQEEAAKKMNISRATFGRIIESARSKTARALYEGCRIEISGGAFVYGDKKHLRCPRCRRTQSRNCGKQEHVKCKHCCQPLQNSEK